MQALELMHNKLAFGHFLTMSEYCYCMHMCISRKCFRYCDVADANYFSLDRRTVVSFRSTLKEPQKRLKRRKIIIIISPLSFFLSFSYI